MSAGLFQRMFAAAEGSLGGTRVRPQAAPAWAPEAPWIEPPPAEAPLVEGLASRAEAAEPPRAMAAPSVRPMRSPATAPPRLQPLNVSVLAADARQLAAEPPHPEPGAAHTRSTPPIEPAQASQSLALLEAISQPPKPRVSPRTSTLAIEAFEATDSPPPLLQPPRPGVAPASPPLGPTAALPRAQPWPAAAAPNAEPTVVHVSIGRVEFLAATPPPSRPRAAPRPAARVPLADYLSGKGS